MKKELSFGQYTERGLAILIIAFVGSIFVSFLATINDVGISILSLQFAVNFLFIQGGIYLLKGGDEYGETHKKIIKISLILFILFTIIIGIYFFSLYLSIQSADASNITEKIEGTLQGIIYLAPIFTIFQAFFVISFTHKLETGKAKMILLTAFILTIVSCFFVVIFATEAFQDWMINFKEYIGQPTYFPSLKEMAIELKIQSLPSEIARINIYLIFGNILFIVALLIAYKKLLSERLTPTFHNIEKINETIDKMSNESIKNQVKVTLYSKTDDKK